MIQISEVGEDFLTTFSDRFTKQSDKMNEFIRIMKKRIQKRKVEEQEAASKLKVQEEEDKLLLEKNARINTCKTLFENVSERISLLQKKCDVDIKPLNDSAVLELKKDSKNWDSEFNDVLDRIAKLGESYPSQFTETSNMMDQIFQSKSDLKTKLDTLRRS